MVKGQPRQNMGFSLDFSQPPAKRAARMRQLHHVLPSPDLGLNPLSTPELEKLISLGTDNELAMFAGLTPTSQMPPENDIFSHITASTPTLRTPTINFELSVQERIQQHMYAQQVAYSNLQSISSLSKDNRITELQQQQQQQIGNQKLQSPSTSTTDNDTSKVSQQSIIFSSPSTSTTDNDTSKVSKPSIKCSSPFLSDDIDALKAERKRERNRIAASKCRRRKNERITQLEGEVQIRDDQLKMLKEELALLKTKTKQDEEQNKLLKQENEHLRGYIILRINEHNSSRQS